MKTETIARSTALGTVLAAVLSLSSITACSESPAHASAASPKAASGGDLAQALPVADGPIEDYQAELLDVAFEAASAFPLMPHIKNRSRAQERVVAACFELDQPQRALAYMDGIDNWRRGAGYADLALYCVRRGETAGLEPYLDRAARIAEECAAEENAQLWRSDRIRMKIASVYARIGETEQATALEGKIADSERGMMRAVDALLVEASGFDELVETLVEVVDTQDLEQARNALTAFARLFDRFYDDEEKRARAEAGIEASLRRVPADVGIGLLMELAGFALDHEDRTRALELVDQAELVLGSIRWRARDRIPFQAGLAVLRHRAGDDGARERLDAALADYEREREGIVDIYRAGVLRSLAEAYASTGNAATAHALYAQAVEAGVQNPNSRPRAEDLSATCSSMARFAVEPDAALLARIFEIRDGLGDPW